MCVHVLHSDQQCVCVYMCCSPPEEWVLPIGKQFPKVRIRFLAALLSPTVWQVGRPDLFDRYNACQCTSKYVHLDHCPRHAYYICPSLRQKGTNTATP